MGFECTKCGTDNGLTFTCGMKCKECGKVMEGYSKKHVEYMLAQHKLAKHGKNQDDKK